MLLSSLVCSSLTHLYVFKPRDGFRYVPSNEDEVFDILNVLDDRLKDANSGVVMAAAKLFLHLTRNMEEMRDDVYERLKVREGLN